MATVVVFLVPLFREQAYIKKQCDGGRADSRIGLAGCGRKATTDRSSPLPASPLCRASTVTATG